MRTVTTSAGPLALVVATCAVASLSCSPPESEGAALGSSPATAAAGRTVQHGVADRARVALARVGARRLVMDPGYEREVNTSFTGVWRGHAFTTYVVPTSALPSSSELTVVARRAIGGQVVDVVTGEHSTVRMLRFVLGPDTWLVAAVGGQSVDAALVRDLLA